MNNRDIIKVTPAGKDNRDHIVGSAINLALTFFALGSALVVGACSKTASSAEKTPTPTPVPENIQHTRPTLNDSAIGLALVTASFNYYGPIFQSGELSVTDQQRREAYKAFTVCKAEAGIVLEKGRGGTNGIPFQHIQLLCERVRGFIETVGKVVNLEKAPTYGQSNALSMDLSSALATVSAMQVEQKNLADQLAAQRTTLATYNSSDKSNISPLVKLV